MKNIDKYDSTIVNFLFFILPLSLIFGNFLTNLNVFLLCVFSFAFYSKKIIKFKINLLDKIVLVFFFYTIISLAVNFFDNYLNNESFSKIVIYKTLFYLRYLIFYLALRVLISQKILRLDWFSLACVACATFVCLDIFFQFSFGKDLFGIKPASERHFSGIFGEENIAGGYLQKFALFSFFLPFVFRKNIFHKVSIQFFLFIVFMFGIVLSGNRMPLILFILSFLLIILLNRELRKYFFTIFIITFILLSLFFKTNLVFRMNISNFYENGANVIKTFFIKDISEDKSGLWKKPYVIQFHCFKYIWGKKPIFGGGIRSYRTYIGCNSHPHNYYLEILSDLGLIGLSIFMILGFMLFRKIFIKKNTIFKLISNSFDNTKVTPFFLILFIEFFPLRSSGSIFATNNSSIIFLVLGILVSLVSAKKLYKN
jgi:O-antigen ligase